MPEFCARIVWHHICKQYGQPSTAYSWLTAHGLWFHAHFLFSGCADIRRIVHRKLLLFFNVFFSLLHSARLCACTAIVVHWNDLNGIRAAGTQFVLLYKQQKTEMNFCIQPINEEWMNDSTDVAAAVYVLSVRLLRFWFILSLAIGIMRFRILYTSVLLLCTITKNVDTHRDWHNRAAAAWREQLNRNPFNLQLNFLFRLRKHMCHGNIFGRTTFFSLFVRSPVWVWLQIHK